MLQRVLPDPFDAKKGLIQINHYRTYIYKTLKAIFIATVLLNLIKVRDERKDALLTRQGLATIKTQALRKGIWYETLSKTERAIVDLTMKCVEKVRSPILSRTIIKILSKIAKALENTFLVKANKIGSELAKRLGSIAERWGNKTAPKWKTDKKLIKFLGVTALNS